MKPKKIKLFAIDSDGVLLNDTYSPAIKIFVESFGIEYSPVIERNVWGAPQETAGYNLALACKIPYSGNKVIKDFFNVRERYLADHPVELLPGVSSVLEMLCNTGARLTSYGGRSKEYSYDKYLSNLQCYFDKDIPYIDVNSFRPGMYEIIKENFNLNYDEVVFIDDINRVAEVCKTLGAGFIGVPASMSHNYQREEMKSTGVKFILNRFSDINEKLIYEVDEYLHSANLWR